jgi:acetoin:2,6-dichlorophenolindophenol oxidoreductase subunit beta
MKEVNVARALRDALREEMLRDERVFLIGEDIGTYGGAFRITRGLLADFGELRVIDTPLSESAIAGAAVGAAIMGMKPVAEIMFQDFATLAIDQILNCAAKLRYLHNGRATVPMVLRAPYGAGIHAGAHHSQSIEAMFCHIPGIKVVCPSTPYDAKGLLKAAIRDPNPVLFFEHKLAYGVKGQVPDEDYTVPLGKADVKREGKDITVVTWGFMVHKVLKAADELKGKGVELEVVDLRTLVPLDAKAIVDSAKKTGRVMIVHEACKTAGFGGEVAAVVAKDAFGYLDAPIERVTAPDIPPPFSPPLEEAFIPQAKDVIRTALAMVGRSGEGG